MSNSGNIITKPIDLVGDIAAVTGCDSGFLDELYYYEDVKMFSKKKPVPWSVNGIPSLDPQSDHPNDWFKGVNGDYGIISKSATVNNLRSFLDGNLNGWTYSRDTLMARMLDFDGYYHGAVNPFQSLYIGADRTGVAPGGTLTFEYQLASNIASDYQLGILDLFAYTPNRGGKMNLADMYLAFVIYQYSNGSYSYYDWCSAQVTLGVLATDPAMHSLTYTAPTTQGNYLFVPVLTNAKKESSSQAIGDIVTIPCKGETAFTVSVTVNPYMQVDAFVLNTGSGQNPDFGNKIYFYCTFFGGSNGGQFNNINLSFETSQGVGYLTLSNVQNAGSAGSLAVGANASVRKPANSDVYSTNWTSSSVTLESFIRQFGGKARIYPPSGSTIPSYSINVREAAGMPGGSVIPF